MYCFIGNMSIKVYLKPKNALEQADYTKLKIHYDFHGESEINLTTPSYTHTSHYLINNLLYYLKIII